MPTRVVLRDDAKETAPRRRRGQSEEFDTRPSLTPPRRIGTSVATPENRPSMQRSLSVNFRTALRRDDEESPRNNEMSTDIRASPRLMGYLSCGLASAVMLVSVMQFYTAGHDEVSVLVFRRQLNETGTNETDTGATGQQDEPDAVYGSTVIRPKLIGSIAVASAGTFFSMVILWMHLDTFCFPQIWRKVFSDGSLYERNLLVALILFWIFGLYVCTSSFSVGEVQANVYFTAWICFFSIVTSYREWRIGAGKRTLTDMLVGERETAQNWIGTLLCSFVAGLSVCDLYAFRNNLVFVVEGKQQQYPQHHWHVALGVVWGSVGACMAMLVMIFCWKTPWYPCGPTKCRFDGRFIEGVVLMAMIGVWFYGILEFTEVDGAVNGPSNAYFSIWGSFFFSILTFGTWLKENRTLVQNATRLSSSERQLSVGAMTASSARSPTTSAVSDRIYTTTRTGDEE